MNMLTDFRPDTNETLLLSVLKSALRSETPAAADFNAFPHSTWERLYHLAVSQGVQALAFDAIHRLPADRQPFHRLKVNWALNVEKITRNYAYYCQVAARLAATLDREGIRMMQLKGLGLAQLYPIPALREGGDLDVYLFGQYSRANRLMKEQGIPVDTSHPKHSCFYFERIPVENHQTFLNVEMYAADRILEKHLRRFLAEEEPEYFTIEDRTIRRPAPNFNALFLGRHASTHFAGGGIVLRHLCDWAIFLTACHQQIDFPAIEQILVEAKILPVVNAFTGIAIRYLGLDAGCFPPYRPNPALEQFVLDEILHPFDSTLSPDASFPAILAFKCKRMFASKRKYEAVYGKTFHRRLWYSAVEHIKHPETILKLQ